MERGGLIMSKFDNVEQNIYEELSLIKVDSSKLKEQVKEKLRVENPVAVSWSKCWKKSIVTAAAMLLLFVFTAVAAVSGGFDWFMEKFNPSFGEIVESVGIYSQDQGIRMEVIGAQKYGNMAIVYLSLQDISGQNRLTTNTDFRDGFNVKMNSEKQNTISQQEIISGSLSWKQEVIYFNEDTNTIYYEFNITADPGTPLTDPLEVGSFLIYFNKENYVDEPIHLSLENINSAESISVIEENIWGGSNLPDDFSLNTKVLKPGHYADMPHGEKDQWISNIGIIDEKLHIQVGKIFNKEFGSSDVNLALLTWDEQVISYDYSLVLLGDENKNILNLELNDYGDSTYKYEEFIFPLVPEEFTVYFNGSVTSGLEGKWNVAVNLDDDSYKNILVLKNDIFVDNNIIEHITLTPLGLQVMGRYEGDQCNISNMDAKIERDKSIIPLQGGGGGDNPTKQTFNVNWNSEKPIDVSLVTAIIINGIRIPVNN